MKESIIWMNSRTWKTVGKSAEIWKQLWEFLVISKNLWESVRIFGNLWESARICSVKSCGNLWELFLATSGNLSGFEEISRDIWESKGNYRNLDINIAIIGNDVKKLPPPPHKVSASNSIFDNTLVRDYLGKCFFDHLVGICGKGSSSAWLWLGQQYDPKEKVWMENL